MLPLMPAAAEARTDGVVPNEQRQNVAATFAGLQRELRFGRVAGCVQPPHVKQGENAF